MFDTLIASNGKDASMRNFILKIIYTIDNDLSPFLSRSLNPVSVEYVDYKRKSAKNSTNQDHDIFEESKTISEDDEVSSMGFGYVSITDILELISVNSPELFNTESDSEKPVSKEYNVYYRDILEEKEPYVSCGFLSELNDNVGEMNVVGRVVKNFSGLVRSNGKCYDIVEVKLKFSKVVSKGASGGSRKNSPARSLLNKNSPIYLSSINDKKTLVPGKKQKSAKLLNSARQLTPVDSFTGASSAPNSTQSTSNSQKTGRSSIMRKIMEKDGLLSSLKETHSSESNSANNFNFLDSSPISNDVFLSSSVNGTSNVSSSNLPSYYSSTGNNFTNSSSNASTSILNSNIVKNVRTSDNDGSLFEDDDQESNYSDINKRFDFTKMKQQQQSANNTISSSDSNTKKKKVFKKKKVPKNKIKNIIKEKENLIPQIFSGGTESMIKTTTGVSFDLHEILMDSDMLSKPATTSNEKLLSSWLPLEDDDIVSNNITKINQKSKLSNEIFDLEPTLSQIASSPQRQQNIEEKSETFFNDLKEMGINMDDSYSDMLPTGIINLSAGDLIGNTSELVLESDFFTNFDSSKRIDNNNIVVADSDNNAFPGINSSPALI